MDTSTVHSILRSTQAFCGELCEKQTLDHGIAYYSSRFAALPEVNQFREVWIEDEANVAAAFEQAAGWFAGRGLRCLRWCTAGGQAGAVLREFLAARGFRARTLHALALTEWKELEAGSDVRVLPARAMRAAFHDTYTAEGLAGDVAARELMAEAYGERLDDPHLDMFVAMVDKRPAGRAALYQVGDFARVIDLAVLPGLDRGGVERALLAQVLSLARRLTFRRVLMQVDAADGELLSSMLRAGFVVDGEFVEFDRDASGAATP